MSDALGAVLSTQEAAIASGKKVLHPGVTDRVQRLFEAIRGYGPPRVSLERAIYFTESFKTTEGQPLVWRWAKALKHIAENLSVTIFDDELIVGRPNTWLGRYTLVYPELDGSIMQAGAEAFIAARGAPDAITVTEELAGPHAAPGAPRNLEAAARLFALTSPASGTIAETYLRSRGITADLDHPALGFLANCYYRAEDSNEPKPLPALIARVTDLNGRITGVHRTWLRTDGGGKADVAEPRKALGDLRGHGVRFGTPSVVLAAGEGIETMLALRSVLLHLPSVAALSAAHLGALRLPERLKRLYIACDNDRAGLDAGLALATRAISQGIAARLLVPDGKDFNDDLKSLGIASLLQRLGPHLWRDDQAH